MFHFLTHFLFCCQGKRAPGDQKVPKVSSLGFGGGCGEGYWFPWITRHLHLPGKTPPDLLARGEDAQIQPKPISSWKPETQGPYSRLHERMAPVTLQDGVAPSVPLAQPMQHEGHVTGKPDRGVLSSLVLGCPPASPLAMTVNVPEQCDMNTQIKDLSGQHMVANPRMSFFWLSMGGVTNLLLQEEEVGERELLFLSSCNDRCYRHNSHCSQPFMVTPWGGTISLQRKQCHEISSSSSPPVTKIPPQAVPVGSAWISIWGAKGKAELDRMAVIKWLSHHVTRSKHSPSLLNNERLLVPAN